MKLIAIDSFIALLEHDSNNFARLAIYLTQYPLDAFLESLPHALQVN